jgi:4-amino-4-deoxy-L-arabinose transferase-like glycosyltransferase
MKNTIDSRGKFLLLLIIVLAAFVRIWQTDQYSIFGDYDEYYTAMTASGIYESKVAPGPFFRLDELTSDSFTERLQDANRDNGNSFLYNLILSLTTGAFGHSEMSMRLFSTFFDLMSIVLVWLIGVKLGVDKKRKLLACLLYAVYPVLVNYAGIIRTYAFTTFCALLLLLLILHVRNEKWSWKNALMIALTATALFLGHFLTYYILIVLFLYFVFRYKKEKLSSTTILSGLGMAAVLCGAFLLFNMRQLTNFSDSSKRYENLTGKSVQEGNMRKLEPVSAGTLVPKTILYFDQFYTGNTYAMKWVQALAGDPMMYVSGLLLLCIPLLLLFFLEKTEANRKWVNLWLWIIMAGHAGALLLVFLSGHMISLGIKYTMFSIPLYLMSAAFYTRRNLVTQGVLVVLFAGSLFTCIGSSSSKGNKAVKITFNGEERDYQSKDQAAFLAQMADIIKENPDTLFVQTPEELVFIEMTGLRTTQHTGYVSELDPDATYLDRCLPFRFYIPD